LKNNDYQYAIAISLLLLAGRAVALNFPGIRLWGVDIFAYWPHPISYAYLILIAAVVFLLGKFGIATEPKTTAETGKVRKDLSWVLAIVGLLLLFRLFSDSANLLGDGPLRIQEIEKKGFYRFFIDTISEPLDYAIHHLSYRYIFKPLGMNAVDCFRFWSYLAGVLYFYSAWILAGKLRRFGAEKWLTLCYMFGWGGVMMFFGYAENYALAAAFSLLTVCLLIDHAQTGKRLNLSLLFFLLAFFMHNLAVVLLPLILYQARNRLLSGKFVTESLPVLITLIVTVGYTIFVQVNKETSSLLISSGRSDPEYTVFSLPHLIDLGNLLFLVLPVSMLLIGFQRLKISDEKLRGMRIGLWLSTLFAVALVILIDPRLGMAKDWDLFALLLLIPHISLFLGIDWHGRSKRFKLIVAVLSLALVSPWIILNSSLAASRQRYWNIAALDPARAWYNYEVLGEHYYYAKDLPLAEKAYSLAVTYKDHPRLFLWLGYVQMEQGKYREAEVNFKETLRLKPDDVYAMNYLANILNRQRRYFEAREYLQKYAATAMGRNDKLVIPSIKILDSLIAAQPDSTNR